MGREGVVNTVAPFFSVIIPSRNRPQMLAAALGSVLEQDFDDFEIVIVDDGSQPGLDLDQLGLEPAAADRIRVCRQDYQLRGRGAGYARNVGVWASRGRYCAFLDDDDTWTAGDHLGRAHRAISAAEPGTVLYMSNQEAHFPDSRAPRCLWLYPLVETLAGGAAALREGCYRPGLEQLVAAGGFSHFNTTIVSRELFDSLSGVDEYISYEEDLDFYLRAIDAAEHILFCPEVVARHNVPDKSRQANLSTSVDQLQKWNIRLYLLDKNMMAARHEAIAQYCHDYYAYTLKHMAEHYAQENNYEYAREFALRALGAQFSLKWFGYSAWLFLKSFLPGGRASE